MTTFMRSLLLCFLSGFLATTVYATNYKSLVLWHANGTQTMIELYKEPRITFDAKSFIIHSPVLEMSFPKNDILKYTFRENSGDTSNEKTEKDALKIDISTSEIRVSGYTGDAPVSLYDVSGKKLPVKVNGGDSLLQIPLSSLTTGIYILKVGHQSFKFSKL